MPRLHRRELLSNFENALSEGGWNYLHLPETERPARYIVYKGDKKIRVSLYIWNLTHGGGNRSVDEYRIQATGLPNSQFEPEIGGKTLILGWWVESSIFAGFDYRRHSGPLGSSPSFQIKMDALRKAQLLRFATYNKSNGELCVAFRPSFLGDYIENLEPIHDCGESNAEVSILDEISESPDSVADEKIQQAIPERRAYAIIETKRALRAIDFRDRVLTAYGHQCAFCGIQLNLIDGSHILPAAHPDSTDETSNGLALCTLHHRAYDRGLVSFNTDYNTQINESLVEELRFLRRANGLDWFKENIRQVIATPPDRRDWPKREFVEMANALRGWG